MLTVFQRNHLLPAYLRLGPKLYPPMVQASRAHVVMLAEQRLLPADRARTLLGGLELLRSAEPVLPEYDGSFEDVYFALERNLADAAGIEQRMLDLQLARSRNDLDAAVFRMLLREEVAVVTERVLDTLTATLAAAERCAQTVVIGFTHRRPAQPTTMGHVLAGYAEALLGQARVYLSVLGELNVSPLGSCAFAGTDLPIDPARLAELLGFDGTVANSYEAVAGADHFAAVATANARAMATGARMARVLQDWMTWQWIETQDEFCQGSSIMPQKRNPVVLEHMMSMAAMEVADATSVLGSIASAWWEDSNTATTDVQERLWAADDRATRFFTLMARLMQTLAVRTPPQTAEIVAAGTTTTAAADALAGHGVPFRGAHAVLGALLAAGEPARWRAEDVLDAAAAVGVEVDTAAAQDAIAAAQRPQAVVGRPQADGPGAAAVGAQAVALAAAAERVADALTSHRRRVAAAEVALDDAVATVLG